MNWQNQKIGILGGGQLGTMLIRAAIDFGLHVSVMDKSTDAPCTRYASQFILGDPLDYDAVLAFGRTVDVLTIEKEAVNIKALQKLEKEGVRVCPSSTVVGLIQNKWIQKQMLQNAGIPIVPGVPILSRDDLKDHLDKLPGCLKRCTQGYDGNGVMMVTTEEDILIAFDGPCVLEELVAIRQELSVIVSRNEHGVVECYDPVLMIFHKERMLLDFQLCPANIEPNLAIEASNIAVRIAETIGLVGIMAVEFFITQEGKLLVNELAPRPHNSGHHTIEACATSQYEQHIRAILGLPLGNSNARGGSVMINILEPAAALKHATNQAMCSILGLSDTHVHWYGKSEGKEGRKIGHITITERNIEDALNKAIIVRHMMNPESDAAENIVFTNKN